MHHIEVMVEIGGLLVTAIVLHFQFKSNDKHIIQQQIPQQPINNNNPYYNCNNFQFNNF